MNFDLKEIDKIIRKNIVDLWFDFRGCPVQFFKENGTEVIFLDQEKKLREIVKKILKGNNIMEEDEEIKEELLECEEEDLIEACQNALETKGSHNPLKYIRELVRGGKYRRKG